MNEIRTKQKGSETTVSKDVQTLIVSSNTIEESKDSLLMCI